MNHRGWIALCLAVSCGVFAVPVPWTNVASAGDVVPLQEGVKDEADVAGQANTIAWTRSVSGGVGIYLGKKHSYDYQTTNYTGNGNITVCSHIVGWYSRDDYALKCGTNTATATVKNHPNVDTMLDVSMQNRSNTTHTLTGSASY